VLSETLPNITVIAIMHRNHIPKNETNKMTSPYKRVQIIINPASGKNEPILNIINAAFAGSGIEWDARVTHKFGDATRLAKEAVANGVDLVAGYGGDGTQLEIANGVFGSGVPMAILPGGTGNAMAFELKVPRDLRQAVELIVNSSNTRLVDLGQIGDRVFLLRVYTGVDAESRASRESKDKYGNMAYVFEGLKFVARPKQAHYKAIIDGQEREGDVIMTYIFNAGSAGGVNLPKLAPVEIDDGLLDLYAITKGLRPLRALSENVFNVGHFNAGIYHWQAKEIILEADPPQTVWIDGEEYGPTPITARVLPKALAVVVP
jgi:YegS/Rv2252/BmrU family lipid kinase